MDIIVWKFCVISWFSLKKFLGLKPVRPAILYVIIYDIKRRKIVQISFKNIVFDQQEHPNQTSYYYANAAKWRPETLQCFCSRKKYQFLVDAAQANKFRLTSVFERVLGDYFANIVMITYMCKATHIFIVWSQLNCYIPNEFNIYNWVGRRPKPIA